MKLTIRKAGVLDDWYVIERAEHDGREWCESTGDGTVRLCASSRICVAEIEGSAQEMRDIAAAIRARNAACSWRCSVDARREPVRLGSPRNDGGVEGTVSLADADDLADQIEALLGSAT